jgi:hypothetical protein
MTDRVVVCKGEEGLMALPREDPALRDPHGVANLL